jgi:sec-independent protein translocase protein TatC
MPTDKDLFSEEKEMVAMSFGEHIEELRARLIMGLLGLMVGVVITFIPPIDLGKRVMSKMEDPAKGALKVFYKDRAEKRAKEAQEAKTVTDNVEAYIPAAALSEAFKIIAPTFPVADAKTLEGKTIKLLIRYGESEMILLQNKLAEERNALVSLAPLETITIFFMVCLVTGLVVASPWVFYQVWAFVGAGLYRHERHYVTKFLPLSLGLFLTGVFLCFFGVLPLTLNFLLQFNVWLGIEPTLRLSDWMSFATILPLVFGLCFQTPLVMIFLERIGVFTVADYRSKRKFAIVIFVVLGAILTPGPDPFSQMLLAVPMILLYELGILMVSRQSRHAHVGVEG